MSDCATTTHHGDACGPDCIWFPERALREHRDKLLAGREVDKRCIAEMQARIERLHEKLEAAESQIIRYERVIDTVRDQRDRRGVELDNLGFVARALLAQLDRGVYGGPERDALRVLAASAGAVIAGVPPGTPTGD